MTKTLLTQAAVAAIAAGAPPVLYGQKKDDDAAGVAAMVLQIKTSIEKRNDELTEKLEKLKTDVGNTSKETVQFKSDIDEQLKANKQDFVDLQAKLDELAQKVSRSGAGGQPERRKTLGQSIVGHEEFKNFKGTKGESLRLKVNGEAGVKAVTNTTGSGEVLVDPQRLPGIVSAADRRMTIRGLLASGQTTSDAVKFVRETYTNNAAPQAGEGAAKAESNLVYTAASAEVITMAHFIRVSRQILGDAPALEAQIDLRLRTGLNYKEELQLLLGSGATNNLTGLVTGATAFARPSGLGQIASATHIDVLRVAGLQATVAEYFVDGYVLNPVDWALIELQKDTTGSYIIGRPDSNGISSLWGVPVVATNAMTASNFLAGSFGQTAQIFDREDTDVLMSGEDIDNFTKNMITILAEKRLTLAIYNALALVQGGFAAAKTDLAA